MKIFNFFIAYGVLMLIGTAGLSDLGTITISQCISQILIVFVFISIGVSDRGVLSYLRIVKLYKSPKQKYKETLHLPRVNCRTVGMVFCIYSYLI